MDYFPQAVEVVLAHEGGYVNDPNDRGGETNFGISKRSHPDRDIKHLTREDAKQIYRENYWEANNYDMLASSALACKMLDLAVNMGGGRANIILQTAYNEISPDDLDVDGRLGPKSISAVNEHPFQDLLLATVKLKAIAYYLSLKSPRYLVGWIKRALS
jgi:lysozyme family protein